MTPMQAEVLKNTRRHIGEWKRSIALFDQGSMTLHANGVDITASHVATLRGYIAQNEELLKTWDPNNLTLDGVEINEQPTRLASEIYPGRPITFAPDPEGYADDLRIFETDEEATADAEQNPGRIAGRIGMDGGSISVLEP